MEALGPKLRRQRRRLGFTLDELAGKTGISKPYLSLIETGRVANPPSDEKLRRLELTLGFTPGELVTQAHLYRTPRDVRAVLAKLMGEATKQAEATERPSDGATKRDLGTAGDDSARQAEGAKNGRVRDGNFVAPSLRRSVASAGPVASSPPSPAAESINLDEAYLSGVLAQLVDRYRGNIEPVATNLIPVINKVAAGYPTDFTDLSYPRGVADEHLSCPDVADTDAFAARVHGDSMAPKYREGDLVVFSPAAGTRDGDDCFVRFADGQTTFKRVFTETTGGADFVRLEPRNPRYPVQTVPAEQITGVYKAVYRYQRLNDD